MPAPRDADILTADELSVAQRYRMLTSLVIPRPIAWVSSRSADGIANLAPFSYYIALAANPALIGVSIGLRAGAVKDTAANIRASRDFCVNVVTERHLAQMNHSAADFPADVDEFAECAVRAAEATHVNAPYVADAAAVLECRLEREVDLSPATNVFFVARVVAFHVPAGTDPDVGARLVPYVPVGRLSGNDYTLVRDVVTAVRPAR